jgi:hypothetical protein
MSGPSVPYVGDPSNYPASINILGGSDTPASTTFNVTSEGLADRTAWLRSAVDTSTLMEWSTTIAVADLIPPSTSVAVNPSACFEPLTQQWLIAADIDQGTSPADFGGLLATPDWGRTWNQTFSYANKNSTGGGLGVICPNAIATDGAGNIFYVLPPDAVTTPLANARFAFSTLTVSPAAHQYTGTQASVQTAFWHPGANLFIEVEATVVSSIWNGGAFSATATGATAPTSLLSSLPASWTGATGGTLHGIYAAVNTGGSLALVGIGAAAGSSASRLMTISAALAFTDLGSPSPLGSNAQIQGVAWSAFNSLWGVLTYDGTNSHLWTTPDLSTWTEVATWTGQAGGVACAGQVWAVTVPTVAGGPGSTWRVLVSNTVASGASATWLGTQMCTSLVAPELFSSGNQLCLVDRGTTPGTGTAVAFSAWAQG